jgi:hypothetical protein
MGELRSTPSNSILVGARALINTDHQLAAERAQSDNQCKNDSAGRMARRIVSSETMKKAESEIETKRKLQVAFAAAA